MALVDTKKIAGVPIRLRMGITAFVLICIVAESPMVDAAGVETGGIVFERECAVCHGTEGRGDGVLAGLLDPRPRDFKKGLYKLKSTESGELPTDADILSTIENGIPGTGMPSFRHLSAQEKNDVVTFVKTLGGPEDEKGSWFDLYEVPAAITVPAAPPPSDASMELGRKLYVSMGCDGCHGKSGRGDGKKPGEMLDDWGRPVHARNFHVGVYKGGSKPRDLYTRIMTGMDGTPMTGFWKDAMSPQERWALVGYLTSLRAPRHVEQPSRDTISITASPEPAGITDPAWHSIVPAKVFRMPLAGGWLHYFEPLDVRAVAAGDRFALLVSWREPGMEDCLSLRVMFSRLEQESTFHLGSKGASLRVWDWKPASDAEAYDSEGPGAGNREPVRILAETAEDGGLRRVMLRGDSPKDAKYALVRIGGCAEGESFVTASTFVELRWPGQ